MCPTVIQKVFVDFVGEHEQIVLLCDRCNTLQFLPAEHFPGGIARRIHDDRLGSGRDRSLDIRYGKGQSGACIFTVTGTASTASSALM